MDPLTVFRDFVINKQLDQVVVDEAEGKVRFADKYSFPAQSATAFRREGTAAYYPLGVVVTFFKWQAEGKPIQEFIRRYTNKSDQVALQDRSDLIKYLTGEVASVLQLDEDVPLVPFEPPAKRQKVDEPEAGAADALQHLFGHEKQLRDRNSLLCAPGANFTPVLHMVDRVLAARKQLEAAGVKAGAQAAAAAAKAKAAGQQRQPGQPSGQQQQQKHAFIKSSGRGDRAVDAKGTLKALGATGLISEKLGLGYGLAAGAAAAAEPRARPAAAAAGGGGQNPSSHQKSSSKGADAGRPSSGSHKSSSSGKLRPIILVPAGYSAMINLYNARQLLEQCHFVSSTEAQAQLAASKQGKPQAPVEFVRTARREGSHKPRYQITDKVPKPGHPDWNRVVAVIVQGKAWQFKDFPFKGADKGDMVDTFSNIFGAYFHYKDDAVPDAVQGWKVAKLPLRRDVRHLDDQVVLEFYDKLDAFLTSKRRTDLDS